MSENTVKIFKRDELKRNPNKRVRIIIHNKVYDVTDFLNEHPGGEEVLLEQIGEDATEAFEDVSHSMDARSMMKKYLIGELHESDRVKTQEKIVKDWADKKDEHRYEQTSRHGKVSAQKKAVSIETKRQVIQKYKQGEKSEYETSPSFPSTPALSKSSWKSWMIPVTLAVLATIIYRFYFHH